MVGRRSGGRVSSTGSGVSGGSHSASAGWACRGFVRAMEADGGQLGPVSLVRGLAVRWGTGGVRIPRVRDVAPGREFMHLKFSCAKGDGVSLCSLAGGGWDGFVGKDAGG